MDIAWKGLKSFLGITRKVYKNFIITVFWLRLATDNDHWYIEFCFYWYPIAT